ncbi:hypothetical protein SPAN111604_04190 [Sphingomonas antarctica]|uniref:acyltransferase family protein n=1 Tax=Sphingomonas antarctica TaxID=2040274 RepID=UPI0039E82905
MPAARDARFEGLRGLAALLVGTQICLEFLIYGQWDQAPETLPRILVYDCDLRVMGSALFWLLAGYWLASRGDGWRGFVHRVFGRLFPAFLVVAVLGWALSAALGQPPALAALLRTLALLHVPVVQPTFASIHGIVTIVLLFYALCLIPPFALSRRRLGVAIVMLFVAMAVMIVVGRWWHVHFPVRIVLGLALAHFGAWARLAGSPGKTGTLLFVVATLLVCRLAWSVAWGAGELWIGQALGFCGAILLFLAVVHARRAWFAALAPIGLLAYELWLVFPPLLAASRFAIDYARIDARLLAIAGSILLAVPLAWALNRFVTRPALTLA